MGQLLTLLTFYNLQYWKDNLGYKTETGLNLLDYELENLGKVSFFNRTLYRVSLQENLNLIYDNTNNAARIKSMCTGGPLAANGTIVDGSHQSMEGQITLRSLEARTHN